MPLVGGIVLVLFGRRIRSLSRSSQDRIADVGSTVSETLGAMKVVQAFGQEERELGRFHGTVERALAESQCSWPDLDAVAVTQGPGLVGSLLVGVSFAKAAA